MASQEIDVHAFTKPFQLTKSMRRELYPSINPTNPALKATGKVVIITGAGGGIGGDIAIAWSQAGATGIVLVGRNQETLAETAQGVKSAGNSKILIHKGDVSNEADVKALYADVSAQFGNKEFVLINSAGTMNKDNLLIADIEPSTWWTDFESNVKGTFLTTHYFIKAFGAKGTIVNIASVGASLSVPGLSSYSAAKLAAIKFGESVNLEYPNIRVFTVHPGIVEASHRGMVVPAFMPFAKDKGIVTGGLSLYLSTEQAEHLRGGFMTANWDVDEMAKHKDEIKEKRLLSLGFLNAKLGPEGHPFET